MLDSPVKSVKALPSFVAVTATVDPASAVTPMTGATFVTRSLLFPESVLVNATVVEVGAVVSTVTVSVLAVDCTFAALSVCVKLKTYTPSANGAPLVPEAGTPSGVHDTCDPVPEMLDSPVKSVKALPSFVAVTATVDPASAVTPMTGATFVTRSLLFPESVLVNATVVEVGAVVSTVTVRLLAVDCTFAALSVCVKLKTYTPSARAAPVLPDAGTPSGVHDTCDPVPEMLDSPVNSVKAVPSFVAVTATVEPASAVTPMTGATFVTRSPLVPESVLVNATVVEVGAVVSTVTVRLLALVCAFAALSVCVKLKTYTPSANAAPVLPEAGTPSGVHDTCDPVPEMLDSPVNSVKALPSFVAVTATVEPASAVTPMTGATFVTRSPLVPESVLVSATVVEVGGDVSTVTVRVAALPVFSATSVAVKLNSYTPSANGAPVVPDVGTPSGVHDTCDPVPEMLDSPVNSVKALPSFVAVTATVEPASAVTPMTGATFVTRSLAVPESVLVRATVGAFGGVVSITTFAVYRPEPPVAGRVSVAALPAASRTVPEVANDEVAT
jgi:hypothetical protein